MAIDLKRYQQIKSDVDRRQREADRAEGALTQVMTRLENEFGCKTLLQAKRKSAKAKQTADDDERKYEQAAEEFERKWGEELER